MQVNIFLQENFLLSSQFHEAFLVSHFSQLYTIARKHGKAWARILRQTQDRDLKFHPFIYKKKLGSRSNLLQNLVSYDSCKRFEWILKNFAELEKSFLKFLL